MEEDGIPNTVTGPVVSDAARRWVAGELDAGTYFAGAWSDARRLVAQDAAERRRARTPARRQRRQRSWSIRSLLSALR